MKVEDFEVVVSPPVGPLKLSTDRTFHTAQNIFYHEYFVIKVVLANCKHEWEVQLPEWLEALTKQINGTDNSELRFQLLISGEWFRSSKVGGRVRLWVFPLSGKDYEILELTLAQALLLHRTVFECFVRTAGESMDCPKELVGLETMTVRDGI